MAAFELTSSLGALLISLAIQTLIIAGFIWCAMRMLRKRGTPAAIIAASLVAALLGFIHFIGPVLGLIALVWLINRFTSAGRFSAVLVVTVAWALGIAATIGLLWLLDTISVSL